MTRIVLSGGRVFDGTGGDPAAGDVAIEAGRIVDVGPSLDGDEAIDVGGRTVLPGFFDCHTHVSLSDVNLWKSVQQPFSLQFYEAATNLRKTLAIGITSIRDAGGRTSGSRRPSSQADPGPADADLDHHAQPDRRPRRTTGTHRASTRRSSSPIPAAVGRRRRARRGAPKVRELHRMGADVIKVATSGGVLSPRDDPRHAHFRPAELEALVEEATAAGMFVMAHAQGADGIKNAVRAGSARSTTGSSSTTRRSS
jgi:imidazolonepropionase-like amidohydrolase